MYSKNQKKSPSDCSPVRNGTLLNHFFTQSVWRGLLSSGRSRRFDAILKRYAKGLWNYRGLTNYDIITWLYGFLSDNWRNEYFFKNELLCHYFMQEHPMDMVALSQLQIARSRADFVLVTDDGVVYEIKTDQDSLTRLGSQLADYFKAFTKVYVVVGSGLLKEVQGSLKNSRVGILLLDRDNQFVEVKKARKDYSHLDVRTMAKILRRPELDKALFDLFGKIPNVGSVDYYRVSYELISKIPVKKMKRVLDGSLKMRMANSRFPCKRELGALGYFWESNLDFDQQISSFCSKVYRSAKKQSLSQRERVDNVAKVLSIF